jgi:gamma-glutamylcyclotransferase (GGCT)/AIG2-like uncharacterized protein YtfP
MPLCFAYGSNMDVAAMAARCPRSRALGVARLARHRFVVMPEGFASVVADPHASVHGVLWDVALADMRALDGYEGVSRGLYRKATLPVVRAEGGSARAVVYLGRGEGGRPKPGYMEGVVAAARSWSLPVAYLRTLENFTPRAAGAQAAADVASATRRVRPRYETPLDR